MKKIIALLSVLCMLFASGCGTKNEVENEQPASDLAYVQDKGEMLIGMTLFAPMDYYDDNGELTGFEVDLGKAVCEKLGVTPKFVEIDWNSKEVELSAKNIDCIWNGMTITEERKANMSVSNPYMGNKQVLIAKAENAEKLAATAENATIVAEAGSAGEELALGNEYFANAKFTAVDSQAKALMEVASNKSDGAIVDFIMSIGSIGEGTDYADLVVVETEDFSPEDYGIAFRKGSDITAEVNKILDELKADGTVAEIAAKYKLEDMVK